MNDDGVRSAEDVVGFWRDAGPERWWQRDDAFDACFCEAFLKTYERAAAGALEGLLTSPTGSGVDVPSAGHSRP